MTLVMLGEQKFAVDLATRCKCFEQLFQIRLLKKLFLYPNWNRHSERLETTWRVREVGLQQALEFDEGLFKKHDVIDAVEIDLGRVQTVADGMGWKGRIMLLARKAFLLSRGNNLAIFDKGSGTVVVEGREAKESHGNLFPLTVQNTV